MSDRLLLDSHIFLWWMLEPERLKIEARQKIEDAGLVLVSVITAWELAIKASLGRLKLPDTVESGVEDAGFKKLGLAFSHTQRIMDLPRYHRDPFDRLLVAQAQWEELTLVSRDRQLADYEIQILWA